MLYKMIFPLFFLTLASPALTLADEPKPPVRNGYLPSHIKRDATKPQAVIAWLKHLSPERFAAWNEGQLKSVTSLDLSSLNINDEDLVYLRGFTNLTKIDLSGSTLSNEGLPFLSAIKSLKQLDLSATAIDDVSSLEKLALTHLDLGQTHIENMDLQSVFAIKSLIHLDLFGTGIDNQGVLPHSRLKLKSIEELTSLQSVDFGQTKVSSAVFAPLKSAADLKEITLSEVSIGSSDQFDFYYRFMTQEGLRLHSFNRLYIRFDRVEKEKLMLLKNVVGLEQVALDGQKLPEDFAEFLIPLKSLKRLSLSRCSVQDESVEDLKQLKNLVYLNIFMHKLSKDKYEELKNTLPNLKSLK